MTRTIASERARTIISAHAIGVVLVIAGCGSNQALPDGNPQQDSDASSSPTDSNVSSHDAMTACPTTLAPGNLFVDYVVDGATIYSGSVSTWAWTVTSDNPCDQLLIDQGLPPSFTITGSSSQSMTWHPVLTGDYAIHVAITPTGGAPISCSPTVHIGGPGIRVEQCSDRPTVTDLDLHMHRGGATTAWFGTADCDYLDCLPTSMQPVNWSFANSPLTACVGDPHGSDWQALGACRNPRIDIDSENDPRPESLVIDNPNNQDSYRIAVNYFAAGTGVSTVHPAVVINCGGQRKAAYGFAPDLVTGFATPGGTAGNLWRVADVIPTVVGGVTTDCTIVALHPPGTTSGYYVTTNNTTY